MTNEEPSPRPRTARYRRIAAQLREEIRAGVYRAGERLPTEVELARRHGVSRVTSAAALAELAREGLVDRAPRRGTVVRGGSAPRSQDVRRPLVAWIQTDIEHTFGLNLLRGIERATRAAGCDLLIYLTGNSTDEEEDAIRNALAAGAMGSILFLQDGETYNAEVLRLVLDRFPLVLVDRALRGLNCATVASDNIGGARMLVEELLTAGHRHICAVAFPPAGTSTIEDRLRGWVQALSGAGVSIDHSLLYTAAELTQIPHDWSLAPAAVERFAAFLQAHPHVTAVFATNALLALLAVRAAEYLGWELPADLSVVCIDPLHAAPLAVQPVTAAVQQSTAIGMAAVSLLQEAMAGKPARRLTLPMHLERAASVGPPAPRPPARHDRPIPADPHFGHSLPLDAVRRVTP